jgi:hypothetical protein
VIENPTDHIGLLNQGDTAERAELAITRGVPPQRRHAVMSIKASAATPSKPKTRFSRAAQVSARCRSVSACAVAGAHAVTVGFVYAGAAQTSVRLQAFDRSSQDNLDVTGHSHIETLTITGPFNPTGPATRPRDAASSPASPQPQRPQPNSPTLATSS